MQRWGSNIKCAESYLHWKQVKRLLLSNANPEFYQRFKIVEMLPNYFNPLTSIFHLFMKVVAMKEVIQSNNTTFKNLLSYEKNISFPKYYSCFHPLYMSTNYPSLFEGQLKLWQSDFIMHTIYKTKPQGCKSQLIHLWSKIWNLRAALMLKAAEN